MAHGKLNFDTGFDAKHFEEQYIDQNKFEKNKIRSALVKNMKTINKSERNIDIQFDLNQFNKKFDDNEQKTIKELKQSSTIDMRKPDEIIQKLLPHQKPIEEIIVNIRELFYKTLEMLINKQNPIPYIMSTPDRYFSGSVFLIIMGTLLLLFSTLMMGPNKDIN